MKHTRISATSLKQNTSDILNSIYYQQVSAVIEKYGKPVAIIQPFHTKKLQTTQSKKSNQDDKYFGSLSDFPSHKTIKEKMKIQSNFPTL